MLGAARGLPWAPWPELGRAQRWSQALDSKRALPAGSDVGLETGAAAGAGAFAGTGVGAELEQANSAATVTRTAQCSSFDMLNLLHQKILSDMVSQPASGDASQTYREKAIFAEGPPAARALPRFGSGVAILPPEVSWRRRDAAGWQDHSLRWWCPRGTDTWCWRSRLCWSTLSLAFTAPSGEFSLQFPDLGLGHVGAGLCRGGLGFRRLSGFLFACHLVVKVRIPEDVLAGLRVMLTQLPVFPPDE